MGEKLDMHTMVYVFSISKERTMDMCNNLEESSENYNEWEKSNFQNIKYFLNSIHMTFSHHKIIDMENYVLIASSQGGSWSEGSGCGYKRATGGPCGDGNVLYFKGASLTSWL